MFTLYIWVVFRMRTEFLFLILLPYLDSFVVRISWLQTMIQEYLVGHPPLYQVAFIMN